MQKHDFTLIELLVVIAIIAAVASLLLNSLTAARQRAWTGSCLNNLRQLGIGYACYAAEYNSTPAVWSTSSRWLDKIAVYLGENSENIRLCPVDRRENSALSYGVNQTIPRDPDHRKREDLLWYGLAVNKIKDPSEFITIADAGKYYIGKDAEGRGTEIRQDGDLMISGGVYSYLALRHSDGFAAAFFDGHGEYIVYKNMPTRFWDYNGDAYEDVD